MSYVVYYQYVISIKMESILTPKSTIIDGCSISYIDTEVGAKSILFLHGNSCSFKTFQHQFADIQLSTSYRLIALDFPGHGESGNTTQPESVYTLPGGANVVNKFIQYLKLTDVVLVGHSAGGHVALEIVNSLPILKGLVIFGTPPVEHKLVSDYFLPNPALAGAFSDNPTDDQITNFIHAEFNDLSAIPTFIFEDFKRTDKLYRKHIGISTATLQFADEVKIVENLKIPIAIFHGENEKLVNVSYINRLKIPNLWRNAVSMIPNAAHFPQLENAKEFNHLIYEFLNFCNQK